MRPTLPVLLILLLAAAPLPAGAEWQLPDGFTAERVVGEPDVRFPMFAALDGEGRLYVAESSGGDLYRELREQSRRCRIVLFEERDGGYGPPRTFAEDLAFPMGMAWHDGRLYVADPPDLIVLEDTTGDGRADRREAVLSGFGHQTNGSLHGPTVGPDGWLYMTVGWPDAYRIDRADGSRLEGRSGAVLRCRLDGSGVEVVAFGFENPIELAWMETGELITTANWFQEPRDGVRDALVHVAEGGTYPRHAHREQRPPLPRTGPSLPAVALRPAVSHSGLLRYEGRVFPPNHRGLFAAEFNTRRVVRYDLEREGASFRGGAETFFARSDPDFHPSDVVEAHDGSLLVVDTGSWYVHHCPTGGIGEARSTGGIWRVRYEAQRPDDPRGAAIPWRELGADGLADLLADGRPAVRQRASRTLQRRGAEGVEALVRLSGRTACDDVRARVLWTLARIPEAEALAPLRESLAGTQADLVAVAARALGRRGDREAADRLEDLLEHSEPHVRMAAAEALGRCGGPRSVPALVAALAGASDPFLDHALAYALFRCAETAQLREALDHPHPRVQRAALHLLDDPRRDGLEAADAAARATSADPELRSAARQVIRGRPEWAEEAVALMQGWIGEEERPPYRLLADYGTAFAFHPPAAQLVADALADPAAEPALHGALLDAMIRHDGPVPAPWVEGLAAALQRPEVRDAALQAVSALGLEELDELLLDLVERAEDRAGRLAALRALAPRHPDLPGRHADLLIAALEGDPLERITAVDLLARADLTADHLARLAGAAADPLVDPGLLLDAAERSQAPPPRQLLEHLAARLEAGWEADTERILALADRAASHRPDAAAELRRRTEALARQQEELWDRYEPLLAGGDSDRGRGLFFGQAACAACHRAEGRGGAGGPDLSRIGLERSGRDLLRSLLFPSAATAQGYEAWVVRTREGGAHIGFIERDSAESLLLRDVAGNRTRIGRDAVREMEPLGRSLMPEGLLAALSEQEARDLLAYLQGLD